MVVAFEQPDRRSVSVNIVYHTNKKPAFGQHYRGGGCARAPQNNTRMTSAD
ncbi:hypothetical protein JYU34_019703 [Plutella xylostella]|uniref:Uncharacterized protein n=1 Tax=Plutella xylostella TaxID=51655 RepID=A0ABQ7PV46_PLUXY|nr:hypothetical protein JYU34_019703 [Plutella xylostella]